MAGDSPATSNEEVARFRRVALDRIERVEQAWNRLVQGGGSHDLAHELARELRALSGEARGICFEQVARVCLTLEELTASAARLSYRVPQDLDLLVMMAIRFVDLLAREPRGRQLAGIDLAGFTRRVDEVLAEVAELRPARVASAASEPMAPGTRAVDRLSASARRRLGRAAVLAFVESVRATGSAREHLHEVWQLLSAELDALGTVALAPRIRRLARQILDEARKGDTDVDITVAVRDDLRVSPEVADALEAALLRLLRDAKPGTIAIRSADGAPEDSELTLVVEHGGASVRLPAPRAAGRLAVHRFTACGGLDLPLAVPAAWTVAPIEGDPVAVDPLHALVPDAAACSPTGGFALRLTRGRFDLCWRAIGPVRQAIAERIGAPADDAPAEVVRVEGREVLLLRPELA